MILSFQDFYRTHSMNIRMLILRTDIRFVTKWRTTALGTSRYVVPHVWFFFCFFLFLIFFANSFLVNWLMFNWISIQHWSLKRWELCLFCQLSMVCFRDNELLAKFDPSTGHVPCLLCFCPITWRCTSRWHNLVRQNKIWHRFWHCLSWHDHIRMLNFCKCLSWNEKPETKCLRRFVVT